MNSNYMNRERRKRKKKIVWISREIYIKIRFESINRNSSHTPHKMQSSISGRVKEMSVWGERVSCHVQPPISKTLKGPRHAFEAQDLAISLNYQQKNIWRVYSMSLPMYINNSLDNVPLPRKEVFFFIFLKLVSFHISFFI